MAVTRVRLVIPSGDRRTGHPMQVPGVRRIDVPGGIGWCFDQDVVVHKDALSWTIPGQRPAVLDDSTYALDFAHTWLIYCFDNDGVLRAVKREDLGVLATGPDLNVIAWVDTHYDLLPRLKGCISFINPVDPVVRLLAGNGSGGYSGDGGDPKLAQVFYPTSVTRHNGTWYIGSNGAIRAVTNDGSRISTVAGTGTPGHNGDSSLLGTQTRVVTGVAFDSAGKMWFTDANDQIAGHDPMSLNYLFYEDIAPTQNFSNGYWLYNNINPSPSFYSGDLLDNDGDHVDFGLAINPDAYDCIRVADLGADTVTSQHHTAKFPAPLFVEGVANPYPWQVSFAASIAIAPDDTVYISDGYDMGLTNHGGTTPSFGNMYLARVNPAATEVTKLVWKRWFYPPTPVPPLGLEGSGNVPNPLANYFQATSFPQQLWLHTNGDLYWADSRTNQVFRYTPGTGVASHVLGGGIASGPPPYFGGQFGRQTLHCPVGVAVDGGGNVYVSDTHNHVVWRWSPGDNSFRAVLGFPGVPGNTPEGSPGSATLIRNPAQIWVSRCGQLAVCDRGNNRVLALGCPC